MEEMTRQRPISDQEWIALALAVKRWRNAALAVLESLEMKPAIDSQSRDPHASRNRVPWGFLCLPEEQRRIGILAAWQALGQWQRAAGTGILCNCRATPPVKP